MTRSTASGSGTVRNRPNPSEPKLWTSLTISRTQSTISEDGVWARMIPLSSLLRGDQQPLETLERVVRDNDKADRFSGHEISKVIESTFASLPRAKKEVAYLREEAFDGTKGSTGALKGLASALIDSLINSMVIDGTFVGADNDIARQLAVLKGMAWAWMIGRSDLMTHQFGQRKLVGELFEGYWIEPDMLPRRDEWELARQTPPSGGESADRWPAKARLICDHIAGMTDAYALHVHAQMSRGEQGRETRFAY